MKEKGIYTHLQTVNVSQWLNIEYFFFYEGTLKTGFRKAFKA